ncbi:MAG TPA: DMT family transporter [Thermoplasmata archaeon]|nr:DMT family transporter [Thermoplasmata archaeon]
MSARSSWVGPGLLLVLATAFISGISTFVNFYAVKGTSSDAFVTVRNVMVAAAFVPVAFAATRSLRAPALRSVDWLRLVVIGLIGGAIPFLLFFHGLQIATAAGGAATASFGYRTLFLWATVFGIVVLHEKFHWRIALGATLLLAGNVLLLSLTSPIWTDGTAYVLAATVLWAAEYTISKRTLKDIPSATVVLGRMGFGAMFLVGYLTLTTQWGTVAGFTGGQWEWVGISAALLGAFVATFYPGLKRVDLGTASSALVLGFPVTWLLAVLVQGSSFTLAQAAGVLAIVAGVGTVIGLTQLREAWLFLHRLGRPQPGFL